MVNIMIQHDNIFDFVSYYMGFKDRVLITYTGPFDKQVLSILGRNIESAISQNPRLSKKIFSIFIELAQNICYYSAERDNISVEEDSGVGTLILEEGEEHYNFLFGNLAESTKISSVITKCERINTLDRDGLREFKRNQRQLPRGDRDGANIGLIQVALTASGPIAAKLIPVDDKISFFALSVKIEK